MKVELIVCAAFRNVTFGLLWLSFGKNDQSVSSALLNVASIMDGLRDIGFPPFLLSFFA